MQNDAILVLLVITALSFDFTNGFHDTGNAMATSIATKALSPKVAVGMSGILNLVGAFLSVSVAATIASGLVQTSDVTLTVIFAGLAGGIAWNLITWFFGIPSSSSHALIGGIIGSTIGAVGSHGVQWHGLVSKVILPAVLSPPIAAAVAIVGTVLVYYFTRGLTSGSRKHGFRIGQIGSAAMVSLAHGSNDAQKTMGVITLALFVNKSIGYHTVAGHEIANKISHGVAKAPNVPLWVIVCCAVAISTGTYLGGWRVIRTLGKGLVEIESPQGMAAESASAAVILLSTHFGYSLSTTHVATGSIMGVGIGKKGAEVRWSVAGRMATAWVLTLPVAGLVGAIAYWISHGIGGTAGGVVLFLILVAMGGYFFLATRKSKVSADNVNEEWTGSVVPESAKAPAA